MTPPLSTRQHVLLANCKLCLESSPKYMAKAKMLRFILQLLLLTGPVGFLQHVQCVFLVS